jgi:hypothetical protein
MKHLTYLGNCSSVIDWNSVIKEIENKEPGYVGPRQSWDDPSVKEFAAIWKSAGYKPVREGGSAEWSMYFPGAQFDKSIAEEFAKFSGRTEWNSCWISKIVPGQCAPWHTDLRVPNSVNPERIYCHMDTLDVGHVLIVEDEHIVNQEQGATYKWSSPDLWHAAFNCGRKPSYLFNMY